MKALLTISLMVLSLAACGNAGGSAITSTVPVGSPTASAMPATPSGASDGTPIVVRDFALDPANITVKGKVILAATNQGPTIHDITIRDSSGAVLGETRDLKPGESETLKLDIPAGSYVIFCSLPGHESLGIKGTLTVTK